MAAPQKPKGDPRLREPPLVSVRLYGGSDNPDTDVDGGNCKLGPVENNSSPELCAWVADKRGYSSREMAV